MAINKTEAGTWVVKFRDQHKHQRERTFDTYKQASEYQKTVLAEVAKGQYVAPSSETVGEMAQQWFQKKLDAEKSYRRSTLVGWEAHIRLYIKPSLGDVKCRDLTVEQVEKTLSEWGARVSPKMTNKVLTTLISIMNLAKKHKRVRDNVAEYADRLKVATEDEGDTEVTGDMVFTVSELRRLIQATESETPKRLMVMVPALTGLRIGETLGLTWPCVDLKTGKIDVRFNLADTDRGKPLKLQPPKSKSSKRTIPSLPAELIRELKVWRLKCPVSDEQFVFAREDGLPYHRNAASKALSKAIVKAGIEKRLTPHSLRHTFASLLLDKGTPLAEVSALLGHRDSVITLRTYTHFAKRESNALDTLSEAIFGTRI
jgi:integrase